MKLAIFFTLISVASTCFAATPVKIECMCTAVDNSESVWIPGVCRQVYDPRTNTYQEICEPGHEAQGMVRVVTPFLRFSADPKKYKAAAHAACVRYIEDNLVGDFDYSTIHISNCKRI